MIRNRIRIVAEEKGVSATKLAYRTEISYNTIKLLWRDPTYPISTDRLEKIAHVLGVSPFDLLEYTPNDKR